MYSKFIKKESPTVWNYSDVLFISALFNLKIYSILFILQESYTNDPFLNTCKGVSSFRYLIFNYV